MSDNDEIDFPFPFPLTVPTPITVPIPGHIRRSRWDDAPLAPNTLDEQRALARAYREYEAILSADLPEPGRSLARIEANLRAARIQEEYRRQGVQMPRSRARNNAATAAAEAAAQEPKKPITTVVSMLPKTIYNEVEADKAGGPERTAAYVRVQRQMLKWLGTNAAETLQPHQARRWTQEIASDKKPTAQDALRLCYYMRSQTLDTYAEVKGGCISLYVNNQTTYVGGPRTDKLYWKQKFKSNVIQYTAPSSRHAAAPSGRRNAFAPQAVLADVQGILNELSGRHAPPLPSGWDAAAAANGWDDPDDEAENEGEAGDEEAEGEEDEDGGEDEQPAAGGSGGQPTQETLAVLMAGAQADLEALLTSDHPDPTAVEVTLAQLEEYRGQLDEA
jgi:predicted RNA-binding Zn ribbon-like protein